MLSISRTTRVFPAIEPTDMRKGFDGLALLLGGIDLGSVKRQTRYERPVTTELQTPTSSL